MFFQLLTISNTIIIILNILPILSAQHLPFCNSSNDIQDKENYTKNVNIKTRRENILCNSIYSSRLITDDDDLFSLPDFDLNQIESDDDANQILKRFRRGRGGGGGGGRGGGGGGGSRGGGGGRFSSSFSRSSSSSSGGSRFFGGSRSSSSGASSSRIFGSRSSSSSSSGSRPGIFSRSSSSDSSGHRVRQAIRSAIGGSSSGKVSSNTGGQHRVREAVRSIFRHSPATKPVVPSISGGLPGAGGSKPGLSDKIRQITHGGGGGGSAYSSGIGGSGFRAGGSSSIFGSGGAGSGFGTGGSGSGGNAWVRAGKKFLPHAVRFGKRYYQRRKYNKGMYAGMGAGTGYYAGSHMNHYHRDGYYPNQYYDYPPVIENPPETINGVPTTSFYCIQEDLNTTLVNQTLDAEGFGTCNISGTLVKCPVEIECLTSEADNCCEDEQGTPYCCGGPLPEEYTSIYSGYEDDAYDAAESINKVLNMITTTFILIATFCFTMWYQQGQ